ncbi:MAG: helix-turn-helix domain-containing protein [Thermodesulfobacteriota bacterium]
MPRRGRREYMKAEDRRAAIIQGARGVFARKGYRGATVEDIRHACGIAQGTLYVHFPNKEAVFKAVIFDAVDRIVLMMAPPDPEGLARRMAEGGDLAAFVAERLSTIFSEVEKDQDIFRLVFREALGIDDEMDEFLSRVNGAMLGQLSQELSLGMELGVLRKMDPRMAAHLVLGTILLLILTHYIEAQGPAPEAHTLAATSADLILRGLAQQNGG